MSSVHYFHRAVCIHGAEQAYREHLLHEETLMYFQWEVNSTDELHCVATAIERAWEDHWKTHLLGELGMDLEVGFCFSLFNFSVCQVFNIEPG